MVRRRAVRVRMEPVLLKGGETVKSLSTAFLADLEEDWWYRVSASPRQGDISDPAREAPAGIFPGHREPGAYHPVGCRVYKSLQSLDESYRRILVTSGVRRQWLELAI
jgi:hypothetical protein